MEKCISEFITAPQVVIGMIVLYILCLPFTIRNYKHQKAKERWFKKRVSWQSRGKR